MAPGVTDVLRGAGTESIQPPSGPTSLGWQNEVARLLRLQRMHEPRVSRERLLWERELLEGASQWGQEFGGEDAAVGPPPAVEAPPFSFREASRTPVLEAPPDEQYHTLKQEMEVEGGFAAQDERDGEAQRRRHRRAWEEADQWPTFYGVFE